jgi:ATP-binding cassette subfamily B protein
MIRKALKEKNKDTTMIIITHRTTTAKEADKIVVLDNGIVSEMGTHEELANGTGLYSKLWEIQGKLEEEFLRVLNGGE